jgi:hypothetical protein
MTATDRRSVDEVVVDERRHVHELDATPAASGAASCGDEERNASAGRGAFPAASARRSDLGDQSRVALDDPSELASTSAR